MDWAMKHKKFCKENALDDRKVKGDSKVRRQVQEEHCEEAKLLVSRLTDSGEEPFKEEFVKVLETCHKVMSSGKATRSAKAKGGKRLKPVKGEEYEQGREDEGPALEDDLQVESDSKERKQKHEEHGEEFKSGLATSSASKVSRQVTP